MGGVFERALAVSRPLPAADVSLLDELTQDFIIADGGHVIAEEGPAPRCLHVIVEGAACLSKTHKDGCRQITAILLPGDFCSLQSCFGTRIDFTISCLNRVKFARITENKVRIMLDRPAIAEAFMMSNIRKEAIYRAWVDNIGNRPSIKRLAHLICELHARLSQVYLIEAGKMPIRINQSQLSNALGLSTVHINRAVKALKDDGLISIASRYLIIKQLRRLHDFAGFDEGYLE